MSAKGSDDFAIELAQEFARRVPPGTAADGPSAKTFARAVDDVCAKAQAFQREHKLGVYGKAKLGTEFKLKLQDLGYPGPLTDELTGILLMRMSAK